ncbi:mitogen-activated protein kinase kinase kinase [Pelomyxa schiedti]|nr:mitogen-activated protein kinase kinase kinase [Pelomyxa schiedti]
MSADTKGESDSRQPAADSEPQEAAPVQLTEKHRRHSRNRTSRDESLGAEAVATAVTTSTATTRASTPPADDQTPRSGEEGSTGSRHKHRHKRSSGAPEGDREKEKDEGALCSSSESTTAASASASASTSASTSEATPTSRTTSPSHSTAAASGGGGGGGGATSAESESPSVPKSTSPAPAEADEKQAFRSIFRHTVALPYSTEAHTLLQKQLRQLNMEEQEAIFRQKMAEIQKMEEMRGQMETQEQANAESNLKKLGEVIENALAGRKTYHNEIPPDALTIETMIGRGAAGKVYKGKYKGEVVAIKHYSEDNIVFDIQEFKKELTLMSVLDHENLIHCLGACTLDHYKLYIITELMPYSLASYITSNPIDTDTCIGFALGITSGMAYLHSYKLIHRDLKTQNVLLNEKLTVKIIDFGTSRVVDTASMMTCNIGTVQYMAPELFANEKYTEKADVYAFGVVLWELITRQTPYADKPSWALPLAVSKGERPTIPKTANPNLAKLIRNCWQVSASKRPPFTEIRDILRKISAESQAQTSKAPVSISGGVKSSSTVESDSVSSGSGKWMLSAEVLSYEMVGTTASTKTSLSQVQSFFIFNNTDSKLKYKLDKFTDSDITLSFNSTSGSIKPREKKDIEVKLTCRTKNNKSLKVPLLIGTERVYLDVIVRCDAGVFGADPGTLKMGVDDRLSVPEVLITLKTALLRNNGLDKPEIFMQPGDPAEVKRLKELLNRGEFDINAPSISAYDIASLIKVWFRSLPTGLLNEIPAHMLVGAETVDQCIAAIQKLNPTNQVILEWLLKLLIDVVNKSSVNRMNSQNLAIAFAPNLYQAIDLETNRLVQPCADLLQVVIAWRVDPTVKHKKGHITMAQAAANLRSSGTVSSSGGVKMMGVGAAHSSISTSSTSPTGTPQSVGMASSGVTTPPPCAPTTGTLMSLPTTIFRDGAPVISQPLAAPRIITVWNFGDEEIIPLGMDNNEKVNPAGDVEHDKEQTECPSVVKEPPTKLTARLVVIMVQMSAVCFSASFMSTMLIPALPAIGQETDRPNAVPWILTASSLVGAVATPIVGGLAAMVKINRLVLITVMVSLYDIGLFMAGIWGDDVLRLVFARSLQGFSSPLFILYYDVIKEYYPPKFVAPLLGVISALFGVGLSVGMIGGAAILEKLSYTEMFLVIGAIVFACGYSNILLLGFPSWREYCAKRTKSVQCPSLNWTQIWQRIRTVDYIGILLLSLGTLLFLIALTKSSSWGWKAAKTICLLIFGFCLLIGFFIFEWFWNPPLLPMKLLTRRDLLFVTLVAFMFGLYSYGLLHILPYLMTDPLGPFQYTSQLKVGIVIFPQGISALIASIFAGTMQKRIGSTTIHTMAAVINLLAISLMIKYHYTAAQLIVLLIIQGFGGGMCMAVQMGIMAKACPDHFPAATGINSFARTIGGAIAPVLNSIFLNEKWYDDDPLHCARGCTKMTSFKDCLIMLSCVSGLQLIFALFVSDQLFLCNKIGDAIVSTKAPKVEEDCELDDRP